MTSPVRIIVGDVREGLRSLAAGSVQCCVTSPPYWGLRDYGTGKWVGGDPKCEHKPSGQSPDPKNPESTARNGRSSAADRMVLGGRCPCGAVKIDRQIGLEATPERFVETMVEVFREVRRVLRDDGTLWLNLGDSYAGSWGAQSRGPTTPGTLEGNDMLSARQIAAARRDESGTGSLKRTPGLKPKDLCMMPWRVALALQADGWYLRSVICWHKRSPMPESVTDRPTSSWEPIFLLAKSDRYFYDAEAVKERLTDEAVKRQAYGFKNMYGGIIEANQHVEKRKHSDAKSYGADDMPGGRNMRNVWSLSAEPYSEAHFATFPSEIPRRAIKAGTSEKGCCPACGAPWVRVVERSKYSPEVVAAGVRNVDESRGDKVRKLSGKEYNEQASSKTVGWQPGCTCGAAVVPCVVLDPFLGSGTTIAAARQLGRHGVGIELNPAYVDMARVRIAKAEKPHTFMDHREPAEKGLFA